LTLTTEELIGPTGTSVLLAVSDTGPGMSESFLRERLFRPFATTKRQGLGLGLYQCRSIVKAHGAHLRVESAPGRGATFRFVLDAAKARPAEREAVPVEPMKEKVPS
jgi:signal transduction histidine kinase